MIRFFYLLLLIFCLAGCSTYQMPPFSHAGVWRMEGNSVINEKAKLKLDCSHQVGLPNFNASDKSENLHFIDSQAAFEQYEPACADYIKDVLKSIPLKFDAIDVIFGDEFIILTPSVGSEWRPDYYRRADGAVFVEQAWPLESLVQPHDQLWRNVIVNEKKHRLITVDRFVKNGQHFAIAQIFQAETKKVPLVNCMADYTNKRNIQQVGTSLDGWFHRWVDASGTDYELGYNDYVNRADQCFMLGDYAGASKAFAQAFMKGDEIQNSHLYNGACAAAKAGQSDLAFEWLNRRLKNDPDWYVEDPNRDTDLASLHNDPRWQTYCDTIIARRDRIEANYDKPLMNRLMDIGQRDQMIRQEWFYAMNAEPRDQALVDSILHEMQKVDKINQIEICDILDTRGFVGSDKVGKACGVYWLVIQHAPLELQKKYLPTFVEAMKRGDLHPSSIALMDDRIAVFEGRPQKYGTQFHEYADGKKVLYPLLDPDMVEQWRQEMEIEPLVDYLNRMGVEMP